MKIFLMLAIICNLQFAMAENIILTENNVCTLDEQVNSTSMRKLELCIIDKVVARRGADSPIYLYINSPGGSVYDGLKFIRFAKTIRNLHTITDFAASMAAAIVESLPGKRYAMEASVFMFHRASGTFSGQFESGEAEKQLELWKKIVRKSEQVQADRIGITLADYKEKVRDEWWIYSDDAITEKVADEMVVVRCSVILSSRKYKKKIVTFLGSYEKEVSACPLVQ